MHTQSVKSIYKKLFKNIKFLNSETCFAPLMPKICHKNIKLILKLKQYNLKANTVW